MHSITVNANIFIKPNQKLRKERQHNVAGYAQKFEVSTEIV